MAINIKDLISSAEYDINKAEPDDLCNYILTFRKYKGVLGLGYTKEEAIQDGFCNLEAYLTFMQEIGRL